MTASDWGTVASLATALGSLVLALATFSAVRRHWNLDRPDSRQAGRPG